MAQLPIPADPADPILAADPISSPTADSERGAPVNFAVEREAEVPVGAQLGWKLRGMIARKFLREGDRLPSVRELAEFAGVNVNTGRAVYHQLEADGLIASEHGRGTFVTERAGSLDEVGSAVEEILAGLRARRLDPREIATALYAADPASPAAIPPTKPPADPDGGDPATLRSELRRQIAHLEEELSNYAWEDQRESEPGSGSMPNRGPIARLTGVEELVEARDRLIDRVTALRADAKLRGDRQEGARAHIESMIRNPTGHRWERISREDVGETGCGEWRVVPKFGPIGAIMGWWRVKVSSGCPRRGPLAAVNHSTGGHADGQIRSR